MELHHEFTVPVPVEDAWRVLLDIERVAPCMPGAIVEDYDGKTVTGSVKVKVGPITVTYRGTAVFEEQDETAHRMVLIASGKETRGQGTARATVTGTLGERDGGTAVTVRTDLTVTGRPAQFGRGVMAEVGDKLVGRFADCLSERLNEPTAAAGSVAASTTSLGSAEDPVASADAAGSPKDPAASAGSAGSPKDPAASAGSDAEPTVSARSGSEPIDLVRAAGLPIAKRVAVPVAAAVAVVMVWLRVRRRRRT